MKSKVPNNAGVSSARFSILFGEVLSHGPHDDEARARAIAERPDVELAGNGMLHERLPQSHVPLQFEPGAAAVAIVRAACAFHIGTPGTICRRCGIPWREHQA